MSSSNPTTPTATTSPSNVRANTSPKRTGRRRQSRREWMLSNRILTLPMKSRLALVANHNTWRAG